MRRALDEAAAGYLSELHRLAPAAARIVDKMPGNFNYLGLAALLLPGARIIHCVRDPRDIGLSIFTFRFYGWHPYAHDLGDLGWYIARHEQLMAHWRDALPNPLLTLRLQDWVGGGTVVYAPHVSAGGAATSNTYTVSGTTLTVTGEILAGLRDGFHADEATLRWTDGLARIPEALLRPFAGAVTLALQIAPRSLPYRVAAPCPTAPPPERSRRLSAAGGGAANR